MLPPLVLILVLLHSVGRIACQGIVFPTDANEGDSCTLSNGKTGQCRKASACSSTGTGGLVLCRFTGAPVVCCDVVQEQCNGNPKNNVSEHIVGVTEKAKVGEFPFMALVMFNGSSQFCGASILSDRFLLTAAHCFVFGSADFVRVGTTEAGDEQADTFPIARIHRHPNYKRLARVNDIALIELQRSITLNSNVGPVCLYSDERELPATQNLTVIGWGNDNSDEPSKVLLKGTVRPVRRSECQQRFDKGILNITLTDGHMCALGDRNVGERFTDACQGDSGGPLVMKRDDRYYLVGVVSTGSGCGNVQSAGVYTWVSKYVKWIVEKKVWRKRP